MASPSWGSYGDGIPGRGWVTSLYCYNYVNIYTLFVLKIDKPHRLKSLVFQLLQGYCVTVVACLYWTRYVPSLLTKPTKEPQKKTGASLEKLMGYMKPYIIRFGAVLSLVVISSLGEMAIPHYTGRMTDLIMNEDKPEAFTVMSLITVMRYSTAYINNWGYDTFESFQLMLSLILLFNFEVKCPNHFHRAFM